MRSSLKSQPIPSNSNKITLILSGGSEAPRIKYSFLVSLIRLVEYISIQTPDIAQPVVAVNRGVDYPSPHYDVSSALTG